MRVYLQINFDSLWTRIIISAALWRHMTAAWCSMVEVDHKLTEGETSVLGRVPLSGPRLAQQSTLMSLTIHLSLAGRGRGPSPALALSTGVTLCRDTMRPSGVHPFLQGGLL